MRGRTPISTIRDVVDAHSSVYDIKRPTYERDERGASDETIATHEADIWLFDPSERSVQTVRGVRLTGTLSGLLVPEDHVRHLADFDAIQSGDKLEHGGAEYEVTGINGLPSNNQLDVVEVNLVHAE